MERDILRKAASILSSETNVKFEFIKQHNYCYPVENICKILGVSKSGYYYWNDRKPSKRALQNLALIEHIKIIHYRNKKRYGSPRIALEREDSVFYASEKLVRRLMKQASLQSLFKRKFKLPTDSFHSNPVAENRLDMEFTVVTLN
jgi:putative transposase